MNLNVEDSWVLYDLHLRPIHPGLYKKVMETRKLDKLVVSSLVDSALETVLERVDDPSISGWLESSHSYFLEKGDRIYHTEESDDFPFRSFSVSGDVVTCGGRLMVQDGRFTIPVSSLKIRDGILDLYEMISEGNSLTLDGSWYIKHPISDANEMFLHHLAMLVNNYHPR